MTGGICSLIVDARSMQGRASSWNDKEGLSPGELQYEARGPVQRYIYIYIYTAVRAEAVKKEKTRMRTVTLVI